MRIQWRLVAELKVQETPRTESRKWEQPRLSFTRSTSQLYAAQCRSKADVVTYFNKFACNCSRENATLVSCLKFIFFHPYPSQKLPLFLNCSVAFWLNSAAALAISGDCIMLVKRPIYAEGACCCLGSEMLIMMELKRSWDMDLFLLSRRDSPRGGCAMPSQAMTDFRIFWNCLSWAMKRVRILSCIGSNVAQKFVILPQMPTIFRCFLKYVISVMVNLVLFSLSILGCPTSSMVLGWYTGGQVKGNSSLEAFSLAYYGKCAPSLSKCTESCGTIRSNLISSVSSSFTGAYSLLPMVSRGIRVMRQYCGLAVGSPVGSLMNSLTTEFSMEIFILRIICLTSCRKKSIGLLSFNSPGSSCWRISADCQRMASLKLSAKLLLGLRSICSPSAATSMLRVESSLHPGSVTRNFLIRP